MEGQRLWISQGGRVSCDEHGGEYLRAAVVRDPGAGQHLTPLDSWLAVDSDSVPGLACEECSR